MRRTAALIAGGGPAGAAAAILLARGRARPLLIERSREAQDVVCGGFMGSDTLAMLDRLGLDVRTLGASAIHKARLVARGRIVETELPFAAAGLSRRALDTALLDHARRAGAAIERGLAIRRVDAHRRRLHLSDGSAIGANAIFLATGKYEVRGASRPDLPDNGLALGLRIKLEPSPALTRELDGVIELHLFRDGYAGVLLQEDGGVNLCLSLSQSRFRAAGGQPERLIERLADEAPLLAERFGAACGSGEWTSVARVPYGWRARRGQHGIFRLGDQAAVIASLAGDGIAIGLSSATHAAQHFLRDGAHAGLSFQPDFAARARRPLALASIVKRCGEAPWLAGSAIRLFSHQPGLMRHAAAMMRIGPG